MTNTKRQSYLINPSFQLKLIGWMTGLALAPICAFFAAHYYSFRKLRLLGEGINLESNHIYFRFLEAQSVNMFWAFMLCSVMAVLVVTVMGLILSNKVAGPIHRLKVHLEQVSHGNGGAELSFRKGDYFSELPAVVNDFVKSQKK